MCLVEVGMECEGQAESRPEMRLKNRVNARLRKGAENDRQLGTLGVIFEDQWNKGSFISAICFFFHYGNFHIATMVLLQRC